MRGLSRGFEKKAKKNQTAAAMRKKSKRRKKAKHPPHLLRHLREQSAQRRESGGPCRVRGGWGCGCLLAEAASGACSSSSASSSAAPLGDDDDRRRCVCARRAARSSLLQLLLEIVSVSLVVGVVDLERSFVIDVGTGGRDSKLARHGRRKKRRRDAGASNREKPKKREFDCFLSLSSSARAPCSSPRARAPWRGATRARRSRGQPAECAFGCVHARGGRE